MVSGMEGLSDEGMEGWRDERIKGWMDEFDFFSIFLFILFLFLLHYSQRLCLKHTSGIRNDYMLLFI